MSKDNETKVRTIRVAMTDAEYNAVKHAAISKKGTVGALTREALKRHFPKPKGGQ